MSHLSAAQVEHLKRKLLGEQRELLQQLKRNDNFGLSDNAGDTTNELSAYDNHPADIGTEMFERSKDIALNENAERHLQNIEHALRSMEAGTYGSCAVCSKAIPYERLEAMPTAAFCVEHAPNQVAPGKHDRPVEEQFLYPPFGRTSLDERDDQNQFDGEDAWQIVESWGTSNTPAMQENPNIIDGYNDMYIESDENDGYVEPLESFLATDIYGGNLIVMRNKAYREYMHNGEGEHTLENDNGDDY